ncbi:hypothetical protein ACH5RR_006993 [Cinchona calisaya]|uniref:Uncharacterized protein n=1 Tax=Cinchona calisaya TaxID=153742 RepID=A0ABD3AQZ2_9GENT
MDDIDGDDIQENPPSRAKGISINEVRASAGKGRKSHDRTNQKRSYDPVDYESIDKIKFWGVEEEPSEELDFEELEAEIEKLPLDDVEWSNSQQVEGFGLK